MQTKKTQLNIKEVKIDHLKAQNSNYGEFAIIYVAHLWSKYLPRTYAIMQLPT